MWQLAWLVQFRVYLHAPIRECWFHRHQNSMGRGRGGGGGGGGESHVPTNISTPTLHADHLLPRERKMWFLVVTIQHATLQKVKWSQLPLASSPGHSQILSRSQDKIWEWPGTRLSCHGNRLTTLKFISLVPSRPHPRQRMSAGLIWIFCH